MIDDIMISRKIFERFSREFLDALDVDVAIAGAGPSGLVLHGFDGKLSKNFLNVFASSFIKNVTQLRAYRIFGGKNVVCSVSPTVS